VAVVGHVEWVQFARVSRIPRPGEVVHASDPLEEPAGGGAVAAVQLARLAGKAVLMTALGDDEHGRRARARLAELDVDVHAATASAPTRRAVTLVDDARERTITTLGARLQPSGDDASLRWQALAQADAIYFTAGDLAALRLAREAARVLVASPRAYDALGHGVAVDVLVLSAEDEIERRALERVHEDAALIVLTEGARGGSYRSGRGRKAGDAGDRRKDGGGHRGDPGGRWAAAELPGEPVDSYGCGDSFAAGLTYALASRMPLADALALAARCGAYCLTGRGPYGRQLTRADLNDERSLNDDRSPG
jgi:ribokinase